MIAAAVGLFAFGGAVAVVLVARQRFRSRATARVGVLFSNGVERIGQDQLRARWDLLPEPVRRYLRYAIPGQAVAIGTAHLKHDGFMRMRPSSRWFRVDGEEYFTVARPGFVWNASLWPAPPVWIEARDSLLSNRGEMLIKVYSLFAIADARSPEIDQGARLRWLAECVWFPYGFIGSGIAWEPIDGRFSQGDAARRRSACERSRRDRRGGEAHLYPGRSVQGFGGRKIGSHALVRALRRLPFLRRFSCALVSRNRLGA